MYQIRQLRKQRGDTIKTLASKIKYDFSNLSKIERGLLNPSIKLLSRIADVYDVNISYFLDEKTYSNEEEKLIEDLELSSEKLAEKYNFTLDGMHITVKEADFIITILRKLRETIREKD
ncbi:MULTISPECIES: helix-turn-helix domain-containing protein [unclassified Fictibacillus]|jgi:transcriptional regulator with XRE-family HTH domain|uniref:helix-turn-helix domain-containing protein n=1 Tax=unclassified Fictibacillus TaxID=2644029 RepID=UPI001E4BD0B2|nr:MULTISPECIES: helix-turn-helix transcriptional regulator [unclassified Fictibacillus]